MIRMDLGAVPVKAYGDPFHPSQIDVPCKLKAGPGIIARIRSLPLFDLHSHGRKPGKAHELCLCGDLERLFPASVPSGPIQESQVSDPVFPQIFGLRHQKRTAQGIGACGPADVFRLLPGKSFHRISQHQTCAQAEYCCPAGLPGQSHFHFTFFKLHTFSSCYNRNPYPLFPVPARSRSTGYDCGRQYAGRRPKLPSETSAGPMVPSLRSTAYASVP